MRCMISFITLAFIILTAHGATRGLDEIKPAVCRYVRIPIPQEVVGNGHEIVFRDYYSNPAFDRIRQGDHAAEVTLKLSHIGTLTCDTHAVLNLLKGIPTPIMFEGSPIFQLHPNNISFCTTPSSNSLAVLAQRSVFTHNFNTKSKKSHSKFIRTDNFDEIARSCVSKLSERLIAGELRQAIAPFQGTHRTSPFLIYFPDKLSSNIIVAEDDHICINIVAGLWTFFVNYFSVYDTQCNCLFISSAILSASMLFLTDTEA